MLHPGSNPVNPEAFQPIVIGAPILPKTHVAFSALTDREAEVGQLMVEGLTNREIGHQLFVNHRTIRFHINNIFKKTGTNSRAQFIVQALTGKTFI